MSFVIAGSIDEAVAAVAEGARPIAGGTDLVVAARQGKSELPSRLVAIDRLTDLATIEADGARLRLGAMATHATLETDPLVAQHATALADAAALVGSPATRNVGTLGGNVMTASPAMDTGAPLLVLDGTAHFRSPGGHRVVALSELWTGPGSTSAGDDELLVAITTDIPPDHSGSAYVRLEYRRSMEIAVAGAAAAINLDDDGSVASARVALTAVAPTIIEVAGVADAIAGRALDAVTRAEVAAMASEQAQPISDLRGSDAYRRHCIGVLASRAIDAAAERARGVPVAVPVNRSRGIGAR